MTSNDASSEEERVVDFLFQANTCIIIRTCIVRRVRTLRILRSFIFYGLDSPFCKVTIRQQENDYLSIRVCSVFQLNISAHFKTKLF